MKFAFSTQNIKRASFLDTCKTAEEYGYAGFEIYDAIRERRIHADSVLRNDHRSDARRWLNNRGLEVSALTVPQAIDSDDVTAELLIQYVNLAENAGIEAVILHIDNEMSDEALAEKLAPAVKAAEALMIELRLETTGYLAQTGHFLEIVNTYASAAIAACWNVRGTFFSAKETPEDTIRQLGAYIRSVRLGDCLDGENVLIGEGSLPVEDVLDALRSLNYEGYVCVDWNDAISDEDIVLTHFVSFLRTKDENDINTTGLYYNRSMTGTFPWKKYDTVQKTFSEVLDVMAETYPDRLAFKYTTLDYTRTYEEYRKDVDDVAAGLIALGVKPGYHVAIWATNVPAWYLTFWAATKIGAVLVTVNTAYKNHEMEYLLRQSDTHTLVMIDGLKDVNYRQIINDLCPELASTPEGQGLYSKSLPFLRNVVTVGFDMPGGITWEEMVERGNEIPREEVRRRASMVRPDDVCNMQYTSGTTGFPKGVMLTHNNIVNNGKIIGDRMDLSTADRMMIQVPMFHCFGMVLSMTSTMTHGGTLCPMPYFSPKSSLACVNDEHITCFNGVPTMFIAMFNHPDFEKTDFSYMRTGIMAGSNCPPDLMRRASAEMNMREIISVYGQTEASPGCTMGEVNEDEEHRVETVGSAFPGVECKIVDPETWEELPDGENGEFVARGFNIMKGYYKMPKATAEAIDADGWLHSGDLCCRTPDGYYKVTGRVKDMIIRGGENLYPREIEEFYLTHPKVSDVQVIGVPDERYGEEACAWIVLHEGETSDDKEMREYGIANIARHKVPRYFMFVDELPMNAAGKVLKYVMKEETIKKLGIKA